ncbi:MAG: histidine phosphatase family protein [Steroidobacteraceae bacterium]|nr:histidine phosphatase family protein [Steroidobacteraceae bacterium]
MPYLYLVRHAQPDFTGHYDSVTELGLQQSAWLGQHFASRGIRFARVVSGSLQRQVHTLEMALQHLPGAPARQVDPRFNEYDAASVLSAFHLGDEQALRASGDRRGYFTAVRSALQAWAQRDAAPEGMESWRTFGARVAAATDEICVGLEPADAVLVVTSGGVIGRLVAATLGADAEAAIQLNLQTRNTGVTEMIRGRSVSRLVAFNAIPHLERPDRAHAVTHS